MLQGFHIHQRRTSVAPAQHWFSARRHVMQVAKRQFAKGYDSVFLSDIAREAHVEDAELAIHFRTKLDLLLALFDEGWAQMNPKLMEIGYATGGAREAMISMLTATMHMLDKDRDLARLLMFEGHRIDPETGRIRVSQGYRRFMSLCTELAVRGQADGSFKTTLAPRVIASAVVHVMEGLMRDRMLAEEDGDRTTFSTNQLIATFDVLVSQFKT